MVATPLQGIHFHSHETHCVASENNNSNMQVSSIMSILLFCYSAIPLFRHSAIPLFLLAQLLWLLAYRV